MTKRLLGCLDAGRRVSAEVVGLRAEPPRTRQAELVAELGENGDRPLGDAQQLSTGRAAACEQSKEGALEQRVGGQSTVAGRSGGLDGFREDAVGPPHVP